jgi:tetratricopeptide (TPR) repeat protein
MLWALELAVLGLALSGVGLAAVLRRRQREAVAISPLIAIVSGIAVLAAAIFTALFARPVEQVTAQTATEEPPGTVAPATGGNPFLPDSASLAAGQRVYEEHCMVCHGLTGHGDGPRSAGTDAVDIIEHVPLHADIEYFDIVPDHANRGDLIYSPGPVSDDDIWHLINYLHAFEVDQLLAEEHFRRARDLAEQGDFEQAVASLDKAIELSPRYVSALQGRGIASLGKGDVEQAVADHSRVIELDPEYGDAYYYRAEAYHSAGELPAAILDYSRAIELDSNRSEAFYSRGLARANGREEELAIGDLERYLELEPQAVNRSAVEELIAQLQGVAGAPPESPTAGAVLEPGDLPAGFEALPPANLGLAEGGPIEIGTTIARSFAFGHRDHFELVWGYTTSLPGEAEKQAFDSRLNVADLLAFLGGGLGANGILESAELPAAGALGDASAGITAVFAFEGRRTRVDGLALRQGDTGMLLFVAYADGEAPSVSLDALASVLALRVGP